MSIGDERPDDEYVTWGAFRRALRYINERINQMATQADVDALTTAVEQVAADLATAKTELQTEIDSLAAANPGLDLSKLQAAVAPLDASVQALGALKPTPAPQPLPAPAAGFSLYTVTDGTAVDTTQWTKVNVETTDTPPRPLYTFSGDTAAGQANGNGADGGAWQLYTGPTQPVPAG